MTNHPIIKRGYYGDFGGQFIPEMLRRNFEELEKAFNEAWADEVFRKEYLELMRDFVGRPTPLQRPNVGVSVVVSRFGSKGRSRSHGGP